MTCRKGASTSFDSEPERTFLRLRREVRGKEVIGEEGLEEDLDVTMEEEVHNHAREGASNHAGQERRVLGFYINPNPGNCRSSILKPAIHANNFELKPQLITLVQNNCSFGGSAQEDLNQHLTTFLRICDTVKANGIYPNTYRLLLFPFSLRDKASKWLESFLKESLTTWENVVNKLLARFYPPQRVNRIRAKVQIFRQQDGIKEGLRLLFRRISQQEKTIEKAIDVIETVSNNEYFYASDRSTNRGVIELNHMNVLLAQNKLITKQLADLTEQMERNQVAVVNTQPPAQKEFNTKEGGDWEQANYVGNPSRQPHDPYSKAYNLGWKNHPNFGFSSDTKKNPKGEIKNVRWEECKAITLRDEEILEEELSKPSEHTQGVPQETLEEKEQGVNHAQMKESMGKEILKPYIPKAPFPHRLKGGEKERTYSRFLDIFKSLHINIPFIEALQ
ncbi:uncharacterized protein LOC107607256 [Arachis ipaensis]|uniref:uncharacterized protein LOC107607256 n=1 Tax=Arachis ipaensis TaxID=130454 RepID=UPI0007AF1865|nr:uncharacterized protein LOC107607256 [Arachis ipaensis]